MEPFAEVLTDVRELVASSGPAGARWRLSEPARQLDANLIHLPAGRHVATHVEPDLDVLLVVVAGSGILGTPRGRRPVAEGNLVWLPHGSTRDITAGDDGLSYLTVHHRRPGLQIRSRPAGDSALSADDALTGGEES